MVEEPLIIAQKMLSNILRLEQRYGIHHNALVLAGSQDAKLLQANHNELSTYGLLKNESRQTIKNWFDQLIAQGFIYKYGEYDTLAITAKGSELLRGKGEPKLLKPAASAKAKSAKITDQSWADVDRELFEDLRDWRREIAVSRSLSAFVIFTVGVLRSIAKVKPQTKKELSKIKGIGQKKLFSYGEQIIDLIADFERKNLAAFLE